MNGRPLRSDPSRLVPLAILGASAVMLGAAYTAQYGFGQEPCILCLYQRIPYAATGVLALLALGLPAQGTVRKGLVALCGVVFLAGAGIAFYHVGVEQHWWASVAACAGGNVTTGLSVEQLNTLLTAPSRQKPCDRVDWSLFGISLAGYNVMISVALAATTLAGARWLGRTR